MVAFTGCDADIATRVTSMGDMTGMVFLLLRKHRQSPQTLGAQWQQAASLESYINYGSGYLQSGSAHRRRTLAYLQSRDEPIKALGSSHMTK